MSLMGPSGYQSAALNDRQSKQVQSNWPSTNMIISQVDEIDNRQHTLTLSRQGVPDSTEQNPS